MPFIGSDSWGSQELTKLCGKDCEGYYFSTHYAPDTASPVAQKFIQAFKATYNAMPDDVAALTYDSFGLLKQAIKDAGKIDRQAVRDAFAKIQKYEGVTGDMQFKEGSSDPDQKRRHPADKGRQVRLFRKCQPLKKGTPFCPVHGRLMRVPVSNMIYVLQQLLNALQLGSIYALIALGYTMVYGILTMINFAHGDLFMVGAFLCFVSVALFNLPFIPTLLLSMVGTAFLGVTIERLAYKPLRQAPRVSAIITALGVGLIPRELHPRPQPLSQAYPQFRSHRHMGNREHLGLVAASHHHRPFPRADGPPRSRRETDDGRHGHARHLL